MLEIFDDCLIETLHKTNLHVYQDDHPACLAGQNGVTS